MALVGWLFDIPALYQYPVGFPGITTNAALGIAAAGWSLWLLGPRGRPAWLVSFGRGLAWFLMALGGLTLAQYLIGVDLG